MEIVKSYYQTGLNGSYFEAYFDNGHQIVIDTVSGYTWGLDDFDESKIEDIVNKYGDGKDMAHEETEIRFDKTKKMVKEYVGANGYR